MTPLRGADGEVYAMAQGSLIVSGFGVSGKDGSRVSVNVPSGGRVPNGATVEREVPNSFGSQSFIVLNLNTPDFTTATRLAEAINRTLGDGIARAADAVSVRVTAPADTAAARRLRFGAAGTGDRARRGAGARHHQFAHRHRRHRRARTRAAGGGGARLAVGDHHASAATSASPMPSRRARRSSTPRSEINVDQAAARMFVFNAGVDLNDIVRAVNQVGAGPGRPGRHSRGAAEAGALRAELIVI